MAWVRFKRDYDYRPTRRGVVAYKKDMKVFVRKEAAERAVAAGAAEYIDRPDRDERTPDNTVSSNVDPDAE